MEVIENTFESQCNLQVTHETAVLEGWLRGGRLHGPARRTEMKKFRTFRQQVGRRRFPSKVDPVTGDMGRSVQGRDSLGAMLAMAGGNYKSRLLPSSHSLSSAFHVG